MHRTSENELDILHCCLRIEKVRMEKSKIDLESCDGVSEYEFPV